MVRSTISSGTVSPVATRLPYSMTAVSTTRAGAVPHRRIRPKLRHISSKYERLSVPGMSDTVAGFPGTFRAACRSTHEGLAMRMRYWAAAGVCSVKLPEASDVTSASPSAWMVAPATPWPRFSALTSRAVVVRGAGPTGGTGEGETGGEPPPHACSASAVRRIPARLMGGPVPDHTSPGKASNGAATARARRSRAPRSSLSGRASAHRFRCRRPPGSRPPTGVRAPPTPRRARPLECDARGR